MDVIDGQQQWRPLRQVGHQPVEPMQAALRSVGVLERRRRRRREYGRREDRRAGQQLSAPLGRSGCHGRLEQLANDPKAVGTLERATPCRQHVEAEAAGAIARFVEQTRLSDAGRALHQDHATASPPCLAQRGTQFGECALAFQKQRGCFGFFARGS